MYNVGVVGEKQGLGPPPLSILICSRDEGGTSSTCFEPNTRTSSIGETTEFVYKNSGRSAHGRRRASDSSVVGWIIVERAGSEKKKDRVPATAALTHTLHQRNPPMTRRKHLAGVQRWG